MRKLTTYSFTVIFLIISATVFAQTRKDVPDYLSVPGPIQFDNQTYNLNWSSHPAPNFYKQEYLAKGDIADRCKTMILMDVVTGQQDVKSIVAAKINELKKMKEANPLIDYEAIQNPATGEYMIDFLLTANGNDGSISIVERNVYRYKVFTDKLGIKGVLLFGISVRGYGGDVNKFFTSLKINRKDLLNKGSQLKMPELTIKK